MIKIEKTEVVGLEAAIRGMRNPKNSWDRSDSFHFGATYILGPNDEDLAGKLANGGPVHAKYRRMIGVYLDITAPLYWWKEFDTYKVGTVRNSCSTMHKIHEKEFTLDDFSHDHMTPGSLELLKVIVSELNTLRRYFLNWDKIDDNTKNANRWINNKKDVWWQMIQLLPSSYNQKATILLNYEVLTDIYRWRKDHKLDEWREFCKWIESLPYSWLITGKKGE